MILWRWMIPSDLPKRTIEQRLDKTITWAIENQYGTWDGAEAQEVSRSQIQRLIADGQLEIIEPQKKLDRKSRLPVSLTVQLTIPTSTEVEATPQDIPLEIVFQDSDIVVINKQPGLTVHPSSTQLDGTLVNALLFHIKDLSGVGGELRPGIVHRIDKETSGLLVIAKNDKSHRHLSDQFSSRKIHRRYIALCYGAPKWETKRIETLLARSSSDRRKMTVQGKEGRVAISNFFLKAIYQRPQQKVGFASAIECKLETGRTHQIRVHLSHLGHSLLGDPTYGLPTANQHKFKTLPHPVKDAAAAMSGQALHAKELGFVHPTTKEDLLFECEPPPLFTQLWNVLKEFAHPETP